MNLLNGIRWLNGAFTGALNWTPTANRSVTMPDQDGAIVLSEFPGSFTATVPLQGSTAYPTQAVSGLGVIAFTLGSGAKSACAKTVYRLTADGTNVPTFTGFTESSESFGYDNRSGIVNVIVFEWDGVTAWYRIYQQRYALPSMSSIAITFTSRTTTSGFVPNQSGNIYSSPAAEGSFFSSLMVSAQTIPSGKAGRLTYKSNQQMLVGFNNTSTLEDYNNIEFALYGLSNLVYTSTAGLNGAFASTASSMAVSSGTLSAGYHWYRLTRNSNGSVLAEASPDGTTWTSIRTFGQTYTGQMWITVNMSGNAAGRQLEFISLEIEP